MCGSYYYRPRNGSLQIGKCPQNPTKTSTSVILVTISKDHMSMQGSQEEQIGHGETTEVLSPLPTLRSLSGKEEPRDPWKKKYMIMMRSLNFS